MRPRGSITGPLILIVVGCLFLLHTISPDFDIGQMLSHDWPYFLILWGVLQLIEVVVRGSRRGAVPLNGVSAGAWILVILIVVFGFASWEWQTPGQWWRHNAWISEDLRFVGDAHDYSFNLIRKTAGRSPHVVIESFRGDAKITGSDGNELIITGRKTIRSTNTAAADSANRQAVVEAVVQDNTVVIRCNQDRGGEHTLVSTDLDISVPRGASIEATGQDGDFDITGVRTVDLSSDNAAVRVQHVDGDVKIDTRRSDQVRCSDIKGAVILHGHGDDVDVSQISGPVSVDGDYSGTISVNAVKEAVRINSMRTRFDVEAVPGKVTLARGSLEVQNVVGPVKVAAQATDVSLNGFTDALDLSVDKGDIDLAPGHTPISKMTIRTHSGDVDLALPPRANFVLTASTAHGDIDNEFSNALQEQSHDHGARLEGTIGSGPEVIVTADRGGITLRKEGQATTANGDPPAATEPPRPPNGPQI